MAKVVPPVPRVRMTENGEALHVVIPARRNWLALVFLPVWLVGWAFGAISTLISLLTKELSGLAILFLLVWLTGWMVGGVSVLFYWLWNVGGREEITVDDCGDFSVRYTIFGFGKTWKFDRAALRNMRVLEGDATHWYTPYLSGLGSARYNGIWYGPLAFDYGAKTYRFGAGMDEAEARDVLPHLLSHLSPDDTAR